MRSHPALLSNCLKACVSHLFCSQIVIYHPNLITRTHLSHLSWGPELFRGCVVVTMKGEEPKGASLLKIMLA